MHIGIIGMGCTGSANQVGFEFLGHTVIGHDPKLNTTIDICYSKSDQVRINISSSSFFLLLIHTSYLVHAASYGAIWFHLSLAYFNGRYFFLIQLLEEICFHLTKMLMLTIKILG